MPRFGRIALIIPFFVGLFFLAATLVTAARTAIFVFGATRTEATFVGALSRPGGSHGGTFYYPRFQFTATNGAVISVTSSSGATDQPFAKGQTVPMLYDPGQPERAVRDSLQLWHESLFLLPFGLVFTVIPVAVFYALRRRARKANPM